MNLNIDRIRQQKPRPQARHRIIIILVARQTHTHRSIIDCPEDIVAVVVVSRDNYLKGTKTWFISLDDSIVWSGNHTPPSTSSSRRTSCLTRGEDNDERCCFQKTRRPMFQLYHLYHFHSLLDSLNYFILAHFGYFIFDSSWGKFQSYE